MKRKKTKKGFIPIKILLGVFIVCVIIFVASLSLSVYKSNNYKKSTGSEKTITINKTFTFRGTTTVNIPSSATSVTPLGNTVNANLFSIKITKVETVAQLSGVSAGKGMQFVKISLYIKNTDNQSSHIITDADFYYQTQNGQRIDDVTNYANLSAANTNDQLAQDIEPQQVDYSDHLVFQVPLGDNGTLVWYADTTKMSNDANLPLPSSSPIYKFAVFAL